MVVKIFGLANRKFFGWSRKFLRPDSRPQTSNQIDAADRIKSQKRQVAGFGPLCHKQLLPCLGQNCNYLVISDRSIEKLISNYRKGWTSPPLIMTYMNTQDRLSASRTVTSVKCYNSLVVYSQNDIVAGQLFFHVAGPVKHLTAFLTQCGYKVLGLLQLGWLTVSSSGLGLFMFIFWYKSLALHKSEAYTCMLNTI